jgi:hypothetical protein
VKYELTIEKLCVCVCVSLNEKKNYCLQGTKDGSGGGRKLNKSFIHHGLNGAELSSQHKEE